jgi:hypothetical protein
LRRRHFDAGFCFSRNSQGQFWPLNLAILLLMRGRIERKVDARLMEMIEFEEIGLPYR